MADLILVLFDPHKAGTVRETHTSLRETLPSRTFEDRILFVLNRIDECGSLNDLLRVYGTLCWNLSQITGRKDIPMIHLTYSPRALMASQNLQSHDLGFLKYLENQREDLKKAVLEAPRYRLDNLATFVETHSERLSHFLEALFSYRRQFRRATLRHTLIGVFISMIGAAAVVSLLAANGMVADSSLLVLIGAGSATTLMILWLAVMVKLLRNRFHRRALKNIDALTQKDNQSRRDTWQAIRELVLKYLEKTSGRFSTREVKQDLETVRVVFERGSKEIREALNELAALRPDVPIIDPPGPFLATLTAEKKKDA